MERRTIRIMTRAVRQEIRHTLQQSNVVYQYTYNTINYSDSRILVSGQSGVRTQASELTSEPELEQFSPVHSDQHEETDSKTVIMTSDDELTDKNDDEDKSDDETDSITEKNYKCNHDDNYDSEFSKASTVAGSIQNFSPDEDECSEPKIIQMSEVTSTEPVNVITEHSPPLDKEIQLDTTKENLSDEIRSLGNLLALDEERRSLEYSPALCGENHLDKTETSLLEEKRSLQYSPALFQENHLDSTEASLLEERRFLEYSPALWEENHLDTTEASLFAERRSLQYSPALFQENHLDTAEASLPEESRSSEYSSVLDVKTQLGTTEANLSEVKKSLGKPKITAEEILPPQQCLKKFNKVFVRRSPDFENINANVDMKNVINSKFFGFDSNERNEAINYNLRFLLSQSEDENRDLTSPTEGKIEDSLNMSKSSVELEDLLGFSQEAAKGLTFVNETRDIIFGAEGNISNSLNTSTSSGQSEDFLGFPREASLENLVSVEGNISNLLNTSTSSEQSEDFLGFSQEAAKGLTFTNETRDIIFGGEGNISNSLNTSTSSGQSEDVLGFPQEASLQNLSNFQDLIENVECDPTTYEFASIIRDTSNCVRSESPSYSYLRNNLPDQMEPLVTVVSPRNYMRSILSPISNLKSSGYLNLIPAIKKLTTLDNEELNKLQRRLRFKRYRLIKKAKLNLETKSSKKSSKKSQEEKKKFKAPKSVWASTKSRRASNKIGKVSTDYFSDKVKTRRMIKESKRREREQQIALLRRRVSNNSLKVEAPKAVSHILRSRKLNFTDCENGQSNVTKSVVPPLPGGVVLKELRVNLTPVAISSFKKNFENKKQIPDSIVDSSLVPETNANFDNDFEEYEHLKYSDNESIKDSSDDSQFTEESSFEEKKSSDPDIDSQKKAINVKRSERVRKRAPKRQSNLARIRDGILTRHQSQIRKVSKKVTFSAEVTVHHFQKNK